MDWKYNADNNGKAVYTRGTNVNIRPTPGLTWSPITTAPTSNTMIGIHDGNYAVKQGSDGKTYVWWKVNFPAPIGGKNYGWIRHDVAVLRNPPSYNDEKKEAQRLLDKTIANNVKIFENLTSSAILLDQLEKKGVNVSRYKAIQQDLSNRLQRRNAEIANSNAIKVKKFMKGAASFVKNVMLKNGIPGALPPLIPPFLQGIGAVSALVIAGFVVASSVATIAVIAFLRPRYDASKVEYSKSEALKNLLTKLGLPEKMADKIVSDINTEMRNQASDAYKAGFDFDMFGNVGKTVKIIGVALVAGGAFWATDKAIKAYNSTKKIDK